MPPSLPSKIQLVINALTYGGRSLGRYNGKAVFIPFTLPGEIVKAQITQEYKNHSVAKLVEVEKPSPQRVIPPCKYFGVCGGCHYQHLAYEDQLKTKQQIFEDTLSRIAKIKTPPVKAILSSPQQTGYRNNVQFHLDENGRLCFYPEDMESTLVPINKCLLAPVSINEFIDNLSFAPLSGINKVSIRLGPDDLMLILEGEEGDIPELAVEADISVVHVTDEDVVVISGNDSLHMQVLNKTFKVSPSSFFQVNSQAAEIMVDQVLGLIDWKSDHVVLDLYCGVGLFSSFLAPKVAKVIGVEVGYSSCSDYESNLDPYDNVELYEGAAEDILPHLEERVDVIIVDPPRAGLDKRVIEAIIGLSPASLIYVSCDPTTLARDLLRFSELGYGLISAQPLDMFPQTFHIESINLLQKL